MAEFAGRDRTGFGGPQSAGVTTDIQRWPTERVFLWYARGTKELGKVDASEGIVRLKRGGPDSCAGTGSRRKRGV